MTQKSLAGLLSGAVLAPVAGVLSWVRQSRMFHPRGLLFHASVEPLASELGDRAETLAGPALVRFSSAWWKEREWLDVLGCAVRFTSEPLSVSPRASDQDLLFATIRRPWTLPFAPFATRFHDFLANDYYAVSPFVFASDRRIEWRLRPEARGSSVDAARERSRAERLRLAVARENATLVLESAPYRPAHRIRDERPFEPVARLRLLAPVALDQEALRFDPFRSGRGIVPVGFVQWLRKLTYSASQRARPSADSSSSSR